ncbi:hypothetical protein T484DRAFT_3406886 [Baffinella frigidus]|nr:hypothetical protein T484DRAFT_3406886 [Cryptophyta sp. CCMP2293]
MNPPPSTIPHPTPSPRRSLPAPSGSGIRDPGFGIRDPGTGAAPEAPARPRASLLESFVPETSGFGYESSKPSPPASPLPPAKPRSRRNSLLGGIGGMGGGVDGSSHSAVAAGSQPRSNSVLTALSRPSREREAPAPSPFSLPFLEPLAAHPRTSTNATRPRSRRNSLTGGLLGLEPLGPTSSITAKPQLRNSSRKSRERGSAPPPQQDLQGGGAGAGGAAGGLHQVTRNPKPETRRS